MRPLPSCWTLLAAAALLTAASGCSPSAGDGEPKGVKFQETAFALYGAGLFLDDRAALEAVERIMNAYGKERNS